MVILRSACDKKSYIGLFGKYDKMHHNKCLTEGKNLKLSAVNCGESSILRVQDIF
jgi:hypothetical protein